ncbi:MAG: hypothetical protein LBE76_09215 [Nitrososphaerota archaeon]|nr:hypothetical protein [Nitrososphaerota archaeon]
MVQGINKSLTWLFTFSLNLALKHLKIPNRPNCKYQTNDIIRALTYLNLQNNYANNGLKRLTKNYKEPTTTTTNNQQKRKTNNKKTN